MASVWNRWNHSKTATLIWFISAITFYCLFRMALQNANHNSLPHFPSVSPMSNSERRARLYNKMARDLDEHGALLIKHGQTSQSLLLSDIFTLKGGSVTPVLKFVDPPVRANVLHLSAEQSVPISEAVRNIFLPYYEKVIWFQNSSLYHFSMYHASHHIVPVPATTEMEVEAEANAVKAIAETLCPLTIVLYRVVLTSTGVVLGCWQILSGTDPITIHAKLRTALPHAPEKQLEVDKTSKLKFFHELVTRLKNQIRGSQVVMFNGYTTSVATVFFGDTLSAIVFDSGIASAKHALKLQATVDEFWYVEEYDALALAINGRMEVRKFQLGCLKT